MNRIRTFSLALALLAVGAATAPDAVAGTRADGFIVIVNAANPTTTITPAQLSKLFLKKSTQWPHGAPAVAVDLSAQSEVRASFTRTIHKRSIDAVKTYWQQQIFSGRESPPVEKASDLEVIALVRDTPGAIGYVSPSTSLQGVKQVVVK